MDNKEPKMLHDLLEGAYKAQNQRLYKFGFKHGYAFILDIFKNWKQIFL